VSRGDAERLWVTEYRGEEGEALPEEEL